MRWGWWGCLAMVALATGAVGCGGFAARRMAQAPNTYPTWLAPEAPVQLSFASRVLTNFPGRFVEVGPPRARIFFRVVEPADYALRLTSTNWLEHGQRRFLVSLRARVPGTPGAWSGAPRGTVVLLHGYGVAQFAMAPWALRLAEDGWRCVLVDLRGHGKSTGKRIYYGVREARDLSQLLDALAADGTLAAPVAAVGESYGAALALRWKASDPRVGRVVAIAPYGALSNAVVNICHEYAGWLPRGLVNAGLRRLPSLLEVAPEQLDTTTILTRHPVPALVVVGTEDKITPPADVRKVYDEASPGSGWIEVPGATHEAVTYEFNDLVPPVLAWLEGGARESTPGSAAGAGAGGGGK